MPKTRRFPKDVAAKRRKEQNRVNQQRYRERLREKRGKSTTPESGSLGGASPSGTIDSGIDVSDTLSTIEVRPITTSLGFPEISSSPTLPCLPALSNGPTAEFSQDSGDGLGFDPSLPQEYFFSLDPALSDTAWAAHIDQTSPIEIPALLDNDLPPPHIYENLDADLSHHSSWTSHIDRISPTSHQQTTQTEVHAPHNNNLRSRQVPEGLDCKGSYHPTQTMPPIPRKKIDRVHLKNMISTILELQDAYRDIEEANLLKTCDK